MYDPAFYSTVVQDWGTNDLISMDLGHHEPNVNIEMIVACFVRFAHRPRQIDDGVCAIAQGQLSHGAQRVMIATIGRRMTSRLQCRPGSGNLRPLVLESRILSRWSLRSV
jgi:hypothetical protein